MQTKKHIRRQKGEGSITQMPNGNYKATITIGRGIDGKQKRRSVTAPTKKELLEKISMLRLDKTPAQARDMTFGELYAEYKREALRDKALSTQRGYTTLWNRIKDEIGGMKLSRLNANLINSLLLSFVNKTTGEALNNSTLIQNRRYLSAIFNFAIAKEYISRNPTHGVLKGTKGIKRADLEIISDDALARLLKDAKDRDKQFFPHSDHIHLYPFILFAVASGMRRGEILGLRKSCVDMETGKVDIRAQVQYNTADLPLKTKRAYRQIYIDLAVLAIVMADSDPDSDFVFSNRRTHEHISMAPLGGTFLRFLKAYDNRPFPTFSIHNLRHYHATKLITAGIDIKSVSMRLGHSDIMTTLERYAHWMPEVDSIAKSIVGANLI